MGSACGINMDNLKIVQPTRDLTKIQMKHNESQRKLTSNSTEECMFDPSPTSAIQATNKFFKWKCP